MTDLIGITAQMRLDAAAAAGWERIGQRFVAEANETYVRWRHVDGRLREAPDPEVKAEPLRQTLRADDIAFFLEACLVCDEPLRWIGPDEEFDFGLVTLYVQLQPVRVELGDVSAIAPGVGPQLIGAPGVQHAVDCLVRPASIMQMVQAAGN
jgi:hypothetical protein